MSLTIRVGIVGVRGYTGQELVRILARHPYVEISYMAARNLKRPIPASSVFPGLGGKLNQSIKPWNLKHAATACDLVFLAVPHGTAMSMAGALLKRGLRVIDLSGDHRLRSTAIFAKAYGRKHSAPQSLREAVYGLTELHREEIFDAGLIANPGCYPTAAVLALAPLAATRRLDPKQVIIDAKSGVTGAGRSVRADLLFSEVNEELHAYKVNRHQHAPEIDQELVRLGKGSFQCIFVPHLVPMNRGLLVTAYLGLKKRVSASQLEKLYRSFYRSEPFVRVLSSKDVPKTSRVVQTNDCEIGVRIAENGKRAIVLAAIDNLGKGAAGQAVQNMNLMLGLNETTGLK